MNENYENFETMEDSVEVEVPMIVEEVNHRNDLVIGAGIGAVAALLVEHVVIPFGSKLYDKIKSKKNPKFHVVEGGNDMEVSDENFDD